MISKCIIKAGSFLITSLSLHYAIRFQSFSNTSFRCKVSKSMSDRVNLHALNFLKLHCHLNWKVFFYFLTVGGLHFWMILVYSSDFVTIFF